MSKKKKQIYSSLVAKKIFIEKYNTINVEIVNFSMFNTVGIEQEVNYTNMLVFEELKRRENGKKIVFKLDLKTIGIFDIYTDLFILFEDVYFNKYIQNLRNKNSILRLGSRFYGKVLCDKFNNYDKFNFDEHELIFSLAELLLIERTYLDGSENSILLVEKSLREFYVDSVLIAEIYCLLNFYCLYVIRNILDINSEVLFEVRKGSTLDDFEDFVFCEPVIEVRYKNNFAKKYSIEEDILEFLIFVNTSTQDSLLDIVLDCIDRIKENFHI